MRVMVVWCPDWSVVAALDEAERSPRSPAAVLSANVVEVCNGPARREGVRRGQRRRDAQARCPDLVLLPANPDRDARAFEPVLATVEDLRPGVAGAAAGPARRPGPGQLVRHARPTAAATACQALVEGGVWDVRIGIADDLFTAEQAARTADVQSWAVVPVRRVRVVPARPARARAPGRRAAGPRAGRACCSGSASARSATSPTCRARRSSTGWAPTAPTVRRRARGEDRALFAARTPPPELDAEVAFEPPLDSVEAITFSVRTTAERFVSQLAHHQLVATGVRVEAESDGVVCSSRAWLHPRHFGARDLVDRVHWQLQSADRRRLAAGPQGVRRGARPDRPGPVRARGGRAGRRPRRGAVGRRVRRPRRARAWPGCRAWSASTPYAGRCCRAVAAPRRGRRWCRGASARSTCARSTGRGRAGCRGRRRSGCSRRPRPPRWSTTRAGRCASPTAASSPASPGASGSAAPTGVLPWQPVTAWAGPWPTDEGWWSGGAGPTARFQVVGADGRAWLLLRAPDGWSLEAGYD